MGRCSFISTRSDLRALSDATLANQLEQAITKLEVLKDSYGNARGIWPLSVVRMQRSSLRQPWAYRLKGRAYQSIQYLDEPPFFGVLFLITETLAPSPARKTMTDALDAYLHKCEAEDLMDEIRRRLALRSPPTDQG
jgi:hypothetical protein